MNTTLIHGDCLEKLKTIPESSVDSIVTDPPYGLNFMGKKWDYDVPSEAIWRECLRVLKPGGHLLAFAGTRTQHRMAVRIEDAGFEIRDMIAWVYGQGFPKSHDVSKAIDKEAGAERETGPVDPARAGRLVNQRGDYETEAGWSAGNRSVTIDPPATEAAKHWQGWGTALKPALEPITVARKPLGEKTVAANVLAHGTGALNIDGCRVGTESTIRNNNVSLGGSGNHIYGNAGPCIAGSASGRWPANLIHDGSDEVVGLFPSQAGGGFGIRGGHSSEHLKGKKATYEVVGFGDTGSAARFFYCAKASKRDREGSTHPTMKPTDLMRYLCRLVTQPNGTVLDPFMGSGSTGKAAMLEKFNFIGIELDKGYFDIASKRIAIVNDNEPFCLK